MITHTTSNSDLSEDSIVVDQRQTDCCIVGGGPAGVVLALLLVRQGVSVILLETHRDFDRDFRGDTIQPSTMEIMDELDLAERLLELPHTKTYQITLKTIRGEKVSFNFSGLKTRYPYITVMPQVKFLEFVVAEAQRYPNFQLLLGANVQALVEERDEIGGVRYRGQGGWHEIRSQVVIGADGRHSRVRELAGLEAIQTSAPMDVLWFRLPRLSEDGEGLNGRIGGGRMVAMLDRGDLWQIAYVFPKGTYQKIRAAGLETLRQNILEVLPEFKDRVQELQDWHQIAFLSVESSYVRKWYRPGLLLIGDAAHVMSPVGGVGINYAIQDAVVAANVLSQPFKEKHIQLSDLAAVQRQRAFPTRAIQTFQSFLQQRIVKTALDKNQAFTPPFFLRLPILRNIPPHLIALGLKPVHVQE
ncbi:FAD-dependent oxidoreductase [Kovacikia minuta CCNUW1]|uniref:FAD-dependent oxidoreductase n=1 Tax=Kovacikia minuta TaxID=2931930 RepID=UPI001CCC0060|nr:FAD-dependent oxidoreductase [Kovacikia minuta]UBF24767.1 FAD-dependent oxidoreductase [Kovacikia minuta CCNUW1]